MDLYINDVASLDMLDQGNALSFVRTLTRSLTLALVLVWVVSALSALGLILLNRRGIFSLLLYIGLPLLIVGVLLCAVGLVGFLIPAINSALAFLSSAYSPLRILAVRALIIGGSMLVVGVVASVVHALVRKSRKKRLTATAA